MIEIVVKQLIKSVVVNAAFTGVGYFSGVYTIMNYAL